jgi:hypothetical protein
VNRRKAHRGTIEQIGQILSIAGIGGGLWPFWLAQQDIPSQSIWNGKDENREESGILRRRGIKLEGRSRTIFPGLTS